MRTTGKRLLSILLCFCMVAVLLPTTAFAAGTGAIQSGAGGIAKGNKVYFGQKGTTVVPWIALPSDGLSQTSVAEGANVLPLLSEYTIGTSNFRDWGGWGYYNYSTVTSGESASVLKTTMDGLYNGSGTTLFSDLEQGAVKKTTLAGDSMSDKNPPAVDAYLFPLSFSEAKSIGWGNNLLKAKSIDTPEGSAGWWWLRSSYYGTLAFCVTEAGSKSFDHIDDTHGVRPAFNLDLNSVLFTSAAAGGKQEGLNKIGDYNGNEWKLTLKDSSRNFDITETGASGKPGDTVMLNYTGATVYNAETAPNEYISVIIEQRGEMLYYGRVAQPSAADGQVEIKIPASLAAGDYTLNVFSEQYNSDYKTDYASNFDPVTLTVDTTAPTLTQGSVTRDSETNATVKFTSDEAGKYYYAVVEKGASEPEITTTGEGTSCDTAEQTISLTSLSGAGAKDIYIVVKDAAGNVSDKLKIEIPAYAPTTPITPSDKVQYVVEHYKADKDAVGGYTLAETERFSDEIGKTVTATPKTYEGYKYNVEKSIASGTLKKIESVADIVTLKLYYDRKSSDGGGGGTILPTYYKLTIETNGGSGSTTGGAYAAGAVINIDAGSRSNYRFDGWTSSNGGSFADASSASTTFTMPAADTTITANWRYIGGGGSTTDYYRLTFETNGGSEIASIRRAEYTTIDLTDYTPIREDYEFTGWYADEDLTKKITSIRLTRNTTVYAGWINPNMTNGVPKTGDSTHIGFWGSMLFFSLAACIALTITLKRRKEPDEKA